jgi:predicted ATPase
VVRELGRFADGQVLSKIAEHLKAVVPGVVSVEHETLGPKETIRFRQQVAGDASPWRFFAAEMSDGTLRSLGIPVAAFQAEMNGQRRVSLVGIEEPEMALHPGAADIIAEVLLLASERVQVLATTHSPDLLNHKAIRDEHLLAVIAEAGETLVGPIEAGVRSVLRDRLYSAGELLSQGPVEPDRSSIEEGRRQLWLFSDRVE